jgi:hypothetical protein
MDPKRFSKLYRRLLDAMYALAERQAKQKILPGYIAINVTHVGVSFGQWLARNGW